jgi:hypothetical protein
MNQNKNQQDLTPGDEVLFLSGLQPFPDTWMYGIIAENSPNMPASLRLSHYSIIPHRIYPSWQNVVVYRKKDEVHKI